MEEEPTMKPNDEVRSEVARAYEKAVTRPATSACGCCGSTQKGAVVGAAGYRPEELGTLPADVVINSFGCGNPVAMAELEPGQVVLDLGAGAGIDLFLAAKRVGPTGRVIGIDMTAAMIARARANIAASGLGNVEVREGIIEDMPVKSDTVDWVISNCVINLSPEKPRVFREIARVLKPGGRMLVSDIVATDLPAELRADPALYTSCVAGAISEEEYLAGLRAAGLVDAAVRDRLVYDADQLVAFFHGENGEGGCCGGPVSMGPSLAAAVKRMVGKVWSAKLFARKPA
jgi:SAM-dependent methyltransferase